MRSLVAVRKTRPILWSRNRVSKTGGLICVPPSLCQVFLASSWTLFLLPLRFRMWVHVGPAMHSFMFCMLCFLCVGASFSEGLRVAGVCVSFESFHFPRDLFRFPFFVPIQPPIRCVPLCTSREVIAISAFHTSLIWDPLISVLTLSLSLWSVVLISTHPLDSYCDTLCSFLSCHHLQQARLL